MALYADSRWDAGIGITDTLTLVQLCIRAMKYSDYQHRFPCFQTSVANF